MKKRPMFGAVYACAAVFAASAALAATSASAQIAPDSSAAGQGGGEATVASSRTYRLRQGDEIALTVFGEPTFTPTAPLRVVQGGSISVPLVGEVRVGGLTTAGASAAIASALHRYLRTPHVTVAVVSVGPVEALVLGNVKTPGKYTLPPPARLTDVIAAAGGLGVTDGDLPLARLETPAGGTSSVSLQALLHDGNEALNVPIESGETVYIPSPTLFNVIVQGAVDKPGDVPMHEGDDVAIAVARAGSSSGLRPDLNNVRVSHTGTDGSRTVTTVNLYPIIQKGDLSHDIKLQKGDLVYVPTAAKSINILDILNPIRGLAPY